VRAAMGLPELAQTDCCRPWPQACFGAGRSPSPPTRGAPYPSPRTLSKVQSATELPTPRQGFDSVPTLKKSPSTTCVAQTTQTKDFLTESNTDSTCSPVAVTPQTPSSADDEMVKEILAQAEAARERATRALETCKESLPLQKARCRRSSRSPTRERPYANNPSPTIFSPVVKEKWVGFAPMEDLVAGVDLVAASNNTPPRVDTPPMRRIAPAFQEPLCPDSPEPQVKAFDSLCGMDSITNLKKGCSTPPWPNRLATGTVPAQIVRPHSYALRSIELELESLNADLVSPNQRAAVDHFTRNTKNGISSAVQVSGESRMESFENWRKSLLNSAFE